MCPAAPRRGAPRRLRRRWRQRRAQEGQAESVAVSEVAVDGDAASAEVALSGGALDGQALEINLVEDGEDWKLDEIVRFTEFDPEALGAAFAARFEGAAGGIPAQITSCLAEKLSSASRSEAEELIFGGSQEPLEEAVIECR